jgi:hypothetical protein
MTVPSLFDQYVAHAERDRRRAIDGMKLVTIDDATEELNPIGHVWWYLHTDLTAPTTSSLYFYDLEILPGSRSGKVQCQGGVIHFVRSGTGHTVVDGEAHEWEPGDVIGIPLKEDGATYQHFNTGAGPARMLVAWPNLDSALGAEGGVAFTVLEPCPEFAAEQAGS